MRVLCISGKRFAGKDTLARLLVLAARRRGVTLSTYAFAGESKRMFAAARPDLDLARLLDDRAYKELWRPQLTQFTVESLAADPLIFVREVMRRIAEPAVITDLRLRLELAHLRAVCDPHVVRITRSDSLRAASGWTFEAAKDTHHTETELDDPSAWNEVVANDGSEAELGARADELLSRWLARSDAPRSDR
jgi:phosphomevalonate kinase